MQKIFVAIALALTLTSAFAGFTATNFTKAPVQVVQNNETNFTTANSLALGSLLGSSDVSIYGLSIIINTTNTTYNASYKTLSTKDLSAGSTQNFSAFFNLTGIVSFFVSNNYAVVIVLNATVSPNTYTAYQQPLNGGAQLPPLSLISGTSLPTAIQTVISGNQVNVFYVSATNTLSYFNFIIAGAAGTNIVTVSSAYITGSLSLATGGALSNQILAIWQENTTPTTLKEGIIDLGKGTVTSNVINGWNSSFTAVAPYVTDGKYYGEVAFILNSTDSTISYYIRSVNTTLTLFNVSQSNQNTWVANFGYGSYLALITKDTSSGTNTIYNYSIIDVGSYTYNKNTTQFITFSSPTVVGLSKVSGGIYALIYDFATNPTTYSNIYVGLVLGSSYLATVLGFLLTIIAGLFLF